MVATSTPHRRPTLEYLSLSFLPISVLFHVVTTMYNVHILQLNDLTVHEPKIHAMGLDTNKNNRKVIVDIFV